MAKPCFAPCSANQRRDWLIEEVSCGHIPGEQCPNEPVAAVVHRPRGPGGVLRCEAYETLEHQCTKLRQAAGVVAIPTQRGRKPRMSRASLPPWNELDYFSIPQRAWRLPLCPSCIEEYGGAAQTQIYLANIFIEAAETFEWSNYGVVRVSVKKGELTAVFGVNVKRTAYFFKDRDIILTESGVKKRIFHIVRAHDRHTKSGVKHIKFHFRGLREFEWAGYKVLITVPGWHHGLLAEARFGMTADYWKTKDENVKCTSPPTTGKIFAAGIRGDHETARKIADGTSEDNAA